MSKPKKIKAFSAELNLPRYKTKFVQPYYWLNGKWYKLQKQNKRIQENYNV